MFTKCSKTVTSCILTPCCPSFKCRITPPFVQGYPGYILTPGVKCKRVIHKDYKCEKMHICLVFFFNFCLKLHQSVEKKWSIVSWILIRENIVWKFWIHVCFYLKVKRLEGLLSRCKETIRSNKEKNSQLEEENAKLTNEIKELTKLKVHNLVMSSEDWQL